MKFFTSTLLTLALSALASAADSAPHIYNISRPLTEISRVLDLGKGIKPPSSGLVPTRRGTNAAQRPQDGVMCMDPPYGYPNVRECNELCHVFLEQPTRKLTINPVSAINWMNGECEFGIANLDPCSPQTIEQGILSVWCLDLLAECVVEQLDGYYDLSGYRMAAALTVDDATPPYDMVGHC